MDAQTLLQELELLNYGDRIKRMVETGQLSKTDPVAGSVISELWKGNKYEKLMALFSAYGTGDVSIALEAVKSPSKLLRRLALRLVVMLATDDQVVDVAMALPIWLHQYLMRQLKKCRQRLRESRQAVIDRLVARAQSSTIPSHAPLLVRALPHASEQHVESCLPQVIDEFEVINWYRLIRCHPKIAYKHILRLIEGVTEADSLFNAYAMRCIHYLTESESTVDLGLNLFKKLLRLFHPDPETIYRLMARRPVETIQVILENGKFLYFDLEKFYDKLPWELILKMFDLQDHRSYKPNLADLSQEQLEATYNHMRQRLLGPNKLLSINILRDLPTDIRILEARRNIQISETMDLQEDLVRNIALLPWEEAMALQSKSLTSRHMHIRECALVAQIRAVKFENERLIDALKMLHRHRNESDPVRRELYSALESLEISLWKENHLDLMEGLIRDALDKPDTSQGSIYQLGKLVSSIGTLHPIWSASQLVLIMTERNWIPPSLNAKDKYSMPEKVRVTHLIGAIHPAILGWRMTEREDNILAFAHSLAYRLELYPELIDILNDIMMEKSSESRASDILRLIYRHRLQSIHPAILSWQSAKSYNDIITFGRFLETNLEFYPKFMDVLEDLLVQGISESQASDIIRLLYKYRPQSIYSTILTWQSAKSYRCIIDFARYLSTDLKLFPKLITILEDLLIKETDESQVSDILNVLYKHRSQLTRRLILSLLERDRSWIYIPLVMYLITNIETHALNRFLFSDDNDLEGRFARRAHISTLAEPRFYRWTITQQNRYAETIMEYIIRGHKDNYLWPTTLECLSKLCFTSGTNLALFFTHDKPSVRMLATRSVTGLDSPIEVLEQHLDTLDTETARTSIFILPHILRDASDTTKLQVLKNVPLTKVTVAKETVRLIAAIGTEEALQHLLQLSSGNLHADVRIALTNSLIAFQHRPQIWELLMKAATASDHVVAGSVTEISIHKFHHTVHPRVASLYTALLDHADPKVHVAALLALKNKFVLDISSKLQLATIKLLGSHDHSVLGLAANLIFHDFPKYHVNFPEDIAEAFKNPLSTVHLFQILRPVSSLARDRKTYVATTQAILKVLKESPNIFCKMSQGLQADIAIMVLPWPENLRAIREMARTMNPDTIRAAVESITRVDNFEAGNLEGLERALSGRENSKSIVAATGKHSASIFTAAEVERRLGLAALFTLVTRTQGWTDEFVARLHTYRQDESMWISEVAYGFSLPGETV